MRSALQRARSAPALALDFTCTLHDELEYVSAVVYESEESRQWLLRALRATTSGELPWCTLRARWVTTLGDAGRRRYELDV